MLTARPCDAEAAAEAAPPPMPMPAPTHIQAADGTWWERKSVPWPQGAPTGKRDVFVNHDSRTVQWDPPPAWAEWQVLKQPVDTIRALAQPQLLAVYKELFRVSGDKNAELYTGSAAMHSSQLDLLLVRPRSRRSRGPSPAMPLDRSLLRDRSRVHSPFDGIEHASRPAAVSRHRSRQRSLCICTRAAVALWRADVHSELSGPGPAPHVQPCLRYACTWHRRGGRSRC